MTLFAADNRQLLVPAEFLHGFVVRTLDTIVAYKCSNIYALGCEGSVCFDDRNLGIEWGITPRDVVLSDKDAAALAFTGFETLFRIETKKDVASVPVQTQ